MIDKAKDYELSRRDAVDLYGLSLIPDEFRQKLLDRHSKKELVRLFSQFIGMANSVVGNTREFVEMFLIAEYKEYPQTAEKINLPTIQGALSGVSAAIPPSKGMCGGCAYRLGTTANQSPITALDAVSCAEDGQKFMCHEKLDDKGEPTEMCVGYARAAMPGRK